MQAVVNTSSLQKYDSRAFTAAGLAHHELPFSRNPGVGRGLIPSNEQARRFLKLLEKAAKDGGGAVALHGDAGREQAVVLVGMYLLKHLEFTAAEAVGYLRVCRPGCLEGVQQLFLRANEQKLRREGRPFRAARHVAAQEAVVQGNAEGMRAKYEQAKVQIQARVAVPTRKWPTATAAEPKPPPPPYRPPLHRFATTLRGSPRVAPPRPVLAPHPPAPMSEYNLRQVSCLPPPRTARGP